MRVEDIVLWLSVPLGFLVACIIAVMAIALSNAKAVDNMRQDIKALKHHTNRLHQLIQRERSKRKEVSFISDGDEKTSK